MFPKPVLKEDYNFTGEILYEYLTDWAGKFNLERLICFSMHLYKVNFTFAKVKTNLLLK